MTEFRRVLFRSSGWSSAPDSDGWYTNQINIPTMKAVYQPQFEVLVTSAELADEERSIVKDVDTYDGYVIAKAAEIPEIDINVRFVGV